VTCAICFSVIGSLTAMDSTHEKSEDKAQRPAGSAGILPATRRRARKAFSVY